MRHLVTGGSGFLGNLIVRRLLAEGAQVRILDVWDDPDRPAGAEFVRGDILDQAVVKQAVQGMDVIHHTAALVPLTKSGDLFRQVNVEGTRLVAKEAVAAGGPELCLPELFGYFWQTALSGPYRRSTGTD